MGRRNNALAGRIATKAIRQINVPLVETTFQFRKAFGPSSARGDFNRINLCNNGAHDKA